MGLMAEREQLKDALELVKDYHREIEQTISFNKGSIVYNNRAYSSVMLADLIVSELNEGPVPTNEDANKQPMVEAWDNDQMGRVMMTLVAVRKNALRPFICVNSDERVKRFHNARLIDTPAKNECKFKSGDKVRFLDCYTPDGAVSTIVKAGTIGHVIKPSTQNLWRIRVDGYSVRRRSDQIELVYNTKDKTIAQLPPGKYRLPTWSPEVYIEITDFGTIRFSQGDMFHKTWLTRTDWELYKG